MGFEVQGIDDLMRELDSLDAERIAPIILQETVPILEEK